MTKWNMCEEMIAKSCNHLYNDKYKALIINNVKNDWLMYSWYIIENDDILILKQ